MARINEQVLQVLTTTGQSATYKYRKRKGHDILAYSLVQGTLPSTGTGGGAIVGTYLLEAASPDSGDWITVADGTFVDSEASGTFVPGRDMDVRWNCTTADTDVVVRIG